MTDVDTTLDTVEGSDRKGPFSSSSIVDAIKQQQRELEDAKEVYIPIKGYETVGLHAKYGLPEGKVLDDIARKVHREVKDNYYRNLNTSMDVMAHLCDGLYIANPDNPDEYLAFDPIVTGQPVGFDADLANVLGLELENPSARQVIKKLFGNKELAILNHSERLQRWLNDSKADVRSELWQLEGNS